MNIGLFIVGLIIAAAGAYGCYYYPKMRKTLSGQIEGTVVRYRKGLGGTGKRGKSRIVWYPTVTYTVNGVTYSYDCFCGANSESEEPVSTEGKTVSLLYNPANPKQCAEAKNIQQKHMMVFTVIVMLVGIGLAVWSFVK